MLSVLLGAAATVSAAGAQVPDTARARPPLAPAPVARTSSLGTPNVDVALEVPALTVDSLGLTVERLRAYLALDANAMNLVALTAGVDASIRRVAIGITGVAAEAYLYADLDNVTRIVARVVQTLNRNPQLLTRLLTVVDAAVGVVGGAAQTALQPGGVVSQAVGAVGPTLQALTAPGGVLTQTIDATGRTVQTVLDASGNLVERTLGAEGRVLGSRVVANVLRLPVLQQTRDAAGRTVRRVRDPAGRLLEVVLDASGRLLGVRLLTAAPPPPR